MKFGSLRYNRKPLWASIMGAVLINAAMVTILMVLIYSFVSVPPVYAQIGSYYTWNVTYTEGGIRRSREDWTSWWTNNETINGNYTSRSAWTIEPVASRNITFGVDEYVVELKALESWVDLSSSRVLMTVAYCDYYFFGPFEGDATTNYTYYDVTETSWTLFQKQSVYVEGFGTFVETNKTYEVEVIGTESVTVPAGIFQCDKIFYNVTKVNNIPVTEIENRTEWISEEVGTYVRAEGKAYDGYETWELTDYGHAHYPGDVNMDWMINVWDLGYLSDAWLTENGDLDYNPDADFNKDNVINVWDLGIMSDHWLESLV